MALRTIRLEDDDILRKKSKPVRNITPRIIALLEDMSDTLDNAEGIGLAAPQIGILKRIAIVRFDGALYELIDPEIVETRGVQHRIEGCLSIPGETGVVDRPEYVRVKYTDRFGDEQFIEGTGLLAVALCHETDHLDGVLYIDKVIDVQEDEDDE